ncbi:MAG: hypothetical protein WEA10_10030 [Actinomycetota bacterium]
MDSNQRNTIVVVMVGVALVAGGVGFALGRAGGEEAPEDAATPRPTVTIPSNEVPGDPPSASPAVDVLSIEGRLLVPSDQAVALASEAAACTSLVTPGWSGDCGQVSVEGGRAVWVVESRAAGGGATARGVRVLTYSADAAGWVTRLAAVDPEGSRWSDIGVAAADLTGDGGAELVVGFREGSADGSLSYDVVAMSTGGVAEVLAHGGPLPDGSVTVEGGLTDYALLSTAAFQRRSFVFSDGLFLASEVEEVPSAEVPASQIG